MPRWYGESALDPEHLVPRQDQWRLQWNRVRRWYERAGQMKTKSATTPLEAYDYDLLLSFFQNCFQLRDWLLECRPDLRPLVRNLFSTKPEMGLCRDIANGFKHKRLDHPSHDPDFNIFREYDHLAADAASGRSPLRYWVAADIHGTLVRIDMFDLIDQCYQHWSTFLSSLPDPP